MNSEYKPPAKFIERRQTTIMLVINSGVKGALNYDKKKYDARKSEVEVGDPDPVTNQEVTWRSVTCFRN